MAQKKPVNISDISEDRKSEYLSKALKAKKDALEHIEDVHVLVSQGNRKTGILVPSVSLIPVADCGNCVNCSKLCYDLRNDLMYNNVVESRGRNSALYKADPARYFDEIYAQIKANYYSFFRWHIGGDIIDRNYLEGMIHIAIELPKVQFLVFTKMFDLVNRYVHDEGRGAIPQNLKIIFSGWPGLDMPNPYNFPSAHPLFADGTTSAHEWKAKYCGGNCSECAYNSDGCWTMQEGDEVVFCAH